MYNRAMEIIYIDSLFFINLVTDYLLCLCSARICGLRLRRLRYLAAALIGAGYSVAVFLPGMGFLSQPAAKLAAGIAVALAAFAGERRPLRCTAVFFAVSAAFGGALWAVGLQGGLSDGRTKISVKFLLCAFTLCYSMGCLIFRCRAKAAEGRKLSVKLFYMGRCAEFTALRDTGNVLSDPLTGSSVMLVCPHALKNIFMENTELFESLGPVELMEISRTVPQLSGRLRLIPYSSLGGKGMLPLFRPDSVLVDGTEHKDILAAVSPSAAGDGFEALI